MILRDILNHNREQYLHCILLGRIVVLSIEVSRNISTFRLIKERGKSLYEMLVLFHTEISHIKVTKFLAKISQHFPAISIDRIDSNLLDYKII
jgi:hypothetical protein